MNASAFLRLAARFIGSILAGLLSLYFFAVATGYISWLPEFGHADIGAAGWVVTIIFLPIAYGLAFLTNENQPPHFVIGLGVALVAGIFFWFYMRRRRQSTDSA